MKICTSCKTEKPFELFYKQSRMSDGYATRCKVCSNKSSALSEQKNQTKYKQIRKDVFKRFREDIRSYKAVRGCQHCRENDPVCLDLHHLDPSVKDLNPADSTSRQMFYNEADKCIVLCANCHRKEHARLKNIGMWAKG